MELENTKATDRVVWLDVGRGIAMMLVILGHAIRQEMRADSETCFVLFRTVYLFHMNLFFFLSGYAYALSKKKHGLMSIKKFTVKKVKSLLLPWFVYSMLIYVVFWVMSKIPAAANMLKGTTYGYVSFPEYLIEIFKGDSPYAYHMWFIYILFFVTMIVFIIEKLSGNPKRAFYILAVVAAAGLVLRAFVLYDSVRILKSTAYFIIWFFAGEIYNDEKAERFRIPSDIFAVISLVILFIFHNYYYDLQDRPVLRGFAILAMNIFIYGVVTGCVRLAKFISSKKNIVEKFFDMVGKNTMAIYLLHQQLCCAILGLVLYNKMHLPIPVVIIACIAASVVVPLALVYVLKKMGLGKVLNVLFAIR